MKRDKPKALITGITGMVGSHLADYLLENTDWIIHGMCRWRSPQNNVEHLIQRVNNGDRIWKLSIHTKDAYAICLEYDQFYLPEGATFFVYNDEKDMMNAMKHLWNREQSNIP